MTGVHWADDHVAWLKSRFPELTEPAYIRTPNEVPTIERLPLAFAWTSSALDVRFRPILEPRGQWFGRGLAIVIADVDRFFAMSWPEQVALLTHETAHQFDSWDSPKRRDDFEWTEEDEWFAHDENIDRVCVAFGMPPITDEEIEPLNHGSAFTRAALHCWWRCQHEISIDQMHVFADAYRSPDFDEAFSSLRSELELGGNIIDLMRTPTPEAFAKLWP